MQEFSLFMKYLVFFAKISQIINKILKNIVIFLISLYQVTISPDHSWIRFLNLKVGCRYYPSCSEFTKQSISKNGLRLGIWQGLIRLLKCHPWSVGGYDPVK